MAVTDVAGFPVLLYLALRYTTASNASLINGTGPLMTALPAGWLLRDWPPRGQVVGTVLSLLGVLLVVSGGPNGALAGFKANIGDVIMVANMALWGLYSVITRFTGRRFVAGELHSPALPYLLNNPGNGGRGTLPHR